MIKIAITGPESTGKSTLAQELSRLMGGVFIPEFAREYLAALGNSYGEGDIEQIAKGQIALEEEASKQAPTFLFCDTEMLVCKVWQEFKYGNCAPFIEQEFRQRHYDLFLLCSPDLPWEEDPLREHPHERQVLFEIYLKALKTYQKPFVVVEGIGAQRIENAMRAIQLLIKQHI